MLVLSQQSRHGDINWRRSNGKAMKDRGDGCSSDLQESGVAHNML